MQYKKISSVHPSTMNRWVKGKLEIYPTHRMVNNWLFEDTKEGIYEAELAHAMAQLAENNGMSANDLQHLFPAVLRILKSTSIWSK